MNNEQYPEDNLISFAVSMQKKYKHIFFDLDRTLWDFDASAAEAFSKIYEKFDLKKRGVASFEKFKQYYTLHNEFLWSLYREGKLEKEVLRGLRFRKTLEEFGIKDDALAEKIGDYYVEISPLLVHLFPNAIEILEYLHPKYELHIITNGFSEVQFTKLKVSGMEKYFREIIISEEAGVKKPDPLIFSYAFNRTKAKAGESLMIGDDAEVDIAGARQIGMDQVLFDPSGKSSKNGATYYVNNLSELKNIL